MIVGTEQVLSWYALNSKPHSEKSVCEGLAARGIEAYLPLWHPPRRSSRAQASLPFFPCYLFARVDLDVVGLSALQYLPGVRRLVFYGDRPARVPQTAIDQIHTRLLELDKCVTDSMGEPLAPGDRVVITGGPLAGLEASFDCRLSSDERVRLLIDFVQTGAHIGIDREFVRKRASGTYPAQPLYRSISRENIKWDAQRTRSFSSPRGMD
jgi:transcriptional antiterminator RfaH